MDTNPVLTKFTDVTVLIPGNVRALAGVQEQVTLVQRIVGMLLASLLGTILRTFLRKTRLLYLALTDEGFVAVTLADGTLEKSETFRFEGISRASVKRGAGMHEVEFDYAGSRKHFNVFNGFVTSADGSYFTDPETGKALMAMAEQVVVALERCGAPPALPLAANAG